MKKNKFMKKGRTLKNNNRRRTMLKRSHQKVLKRRKMYHSYDMFTDLAQAS